LFSKSIIFGTSSFLLSIQIIYNEGQLFCFTRLFILSFIESHSSENQLNIHSPILATVKSKSDQTSTSLSNRLYYTLNNDKPPVTSTRNNHRSPCLNIVTIDDPNPLHQNRQLSTSPMALNKNRSTQQQNRTYSNHERLPQRPTPVVKSTPIKTTITVSKSPRVREIIRAILLQFI
jgi:hypothetical protein